MKRYLKISTILSVLFFILYSALWFYQSQVIEEFTNKSLIQFTKKLVGKSSDFVYTKSSVSGYPFSLDVKIEQPKIIVDNNNLLYEVSSQKPLIISSNIIGTRMLAILPDNLLISNLNNEKEKWEVNYNSSPNIKIRSAYKDTLGFLLNGLGGGLSSPSLLVKEVSYKDFGYTMTKQGFDGMFSHADGLFFNLKSGRNATDGSAFDLMLDLKGANIDKLIYFSDADMQLGLINFSADVSYTGEIDNNSGGYVETNFRIRDFMLDTEMFDVGLSGTIGGLQSEPLPFGDLQVRLGKYSNFVDYQKSAINYIVQNSAFPVFTINDRQSKSFKDFLYTISSESYNDEEDILILFKRDKGEDLRVGQYNFFELLQLFKNNIKSQK